MVRVLLEECRARVDPAVFAEIMAGSDSGSDSGNGSDAGNVSNVANASTTSGGAGTATQQPSGQASAAASNVTNPPATSQAGPAMATQDPSVQTPVPARTRPSWAANEAEFNSMTLEQVQEFNQQVNRIHERGPIFFAIPNTALPPNFLLEGDTPEARLENERTRLLSAPSIQIHNVESLEEMEPVPPRTRRDAEEPEEGAGSAGGASS